MFCFMLSILFKLGFNFSYIMKMDFDDRDDNEVRAWNRKSAVCMKFVAQPEVYNFMVSGRALITKTVSE